MMLEAVTAVILVVWLDAILITRRIEREKQKTAKQIVALQAAVAQLRGGLKKIQGLNLQTQINSKIAQKMADSSVRLAQDSAVRVGALEKSTHRVQFITADQAIAKNLKAETDMDRILNPGNEDFDWLNPVLSEDMDD